MSDTKGEGRKQVLLQEGLFAVANDGRYRLLATACDTCKLVFFPKRKYCAKCGEAGLRELMLSEHGKVYTFSLIDRKSKHTIIEPPYVQAEVQMPEGIRVYTVLDQCAAEDVRVGMDVEVYVDKVSEDSNGNDIIAYKFRPAGTTNRPEGAGL